MLSILRTGRARSSFPLQAWYKHAFSTTAVAARKGGLKYNRKRIQKLTEAAAEKVIGQIENGKAIPNLRQKFEGWVSRDQTQSTKTYEVFRRLALNRFDTYLSTAGSWSAKKDEYASFQVQTQEDFDVQANLFRSAIDKACHLASQTKAVSRLDNPLFWSLRSAFVQGDVLGLSKEISYAFQNFLMRSRFSKSIAATQRKIADFRFPHEWFPATRAMQRTVHLHVGPTNSGKTYNALKALENAQSGIYAGPLRLLAHEVYTRFLAKGKPCALITGEEQRIPEDDDLYFRSCTVEMTPLNQVVDIAVIDEIQMIGDRERGWAWTQAFLGVRAREVHLCGEERSVELIQSLCDTIGDNCVIHRYKRLSALEPMNTSLRGNLKNLQKGDAVVAFSRLSIHALKRSIETATGKRCAIVYGSLPPETRAQQAALFNDPNNDYDYLAASDAIGMGLNLEIKRVVFESVHKHDGQNFRIMNTSEIKQIGGRAGRYKTASQAIRTDSGGAAPGEEATQDPTRRRPGLVTTLEHDDLDAIHEAFGREPEQIQRAGLQPPPSVIERFSTYFPPNTPFSYILLRLRNLAALSPRFHMCSPKEILDVADLIQPYPMSVYDRCVFLNAPVFLRERDGAKILQAFARCVSNMEGGDLLDIPEIELEFLDMDKESFGGSATEYLSRLETLHKTITLYLWLSYRYSGVFRSQSLAFHVKGLVEAKINAHLAELNISDEQRRARGAKIRQAAKKRREQQQEVLDELNQSEQPTSEATR